MTSVMTKLTLPIGKNRVSNQVRIEFESSSNQVRIEFESSSNRIQNEFEVGQIHITFSSFSAISVHSLCILTKKYCPIENTSIF